MENRLDKFFKDRLSKHGEIPSPQAWDQIHGQLVSKRRKVWGKRIAIAASILLFSTVGFFGYRSLNMLTINKDQLAAKSIDENKISERQSNTDKGIIEYKDSGETIATVKIETNERPGPISEVKRVELSTTDSPDNNIQEKMPFAATVELDNAEISNDIKAEEQEEISEENVLPGQSFEVVLTEKKAIDKAQEIQKFEAQKKSYPKVTIIYKANKNSELVTSGEKTLMDKGINKITKFSDEHVLTADRKTKLRNTKEDLLALNFGKLLNKSN